MSSAFYKEITQSIIDTDFYKLTMMQAVLHHYSNTNVSWAFKCRDNENLLPYKDEIIDEIEKLRHLTLTDEEADYLASIPYFKPDFVRFLKLFRFNPDYVNVFDDHGQLGVRIEDKPWSHVILFEIVVLYIISEVRNRNLYPDTTLESATERFNEKLAYIDTWEKEYREAFKLADFGTRRRFSRKVQYETLCIMKEKMGDQFVGTSNVKMAMDLNVKPMGTMAHEWIMAHQQTGVRLVDSQKAALETWVQEYRGELGIALTDCITLDAFLRDFDLYFAKLFDGLRHDSGDPLVFANKCIKHYKSLRIDPMTKTLVFSDGLNLEKCYTILKCCYRKINTSFGMGTNLMCDIPTVKPLNMVMKMIECNGQPVAKHSDSPGKGMCEDEQFISYLKKVFDVS